MCVGRLVGGGEIALYVAPPARLKELASAGFDINLASAHTTGGAYVTTPLVVMYAPLRIGSRVAQTCCFLVCRQGAYIPAKNAGTYAPPAGINRGGAHLAGGYRRGDK